MSFAQEIKKEILSSELSIDQARSLVSGLVASSGQGEGSKRTVKLNNGDLSDQIREILVEMNISHETTKENKNWIIFSSDIGEEEIKIPGQFFAGAFLGGGSISDPQSTSYHLELQFYSHRLATKVKSFLDKYDFEFSLIQRRKNWVLYLKKSEKISDFLRAIEVFNSLMLFEDARIERDFKNHLNRYSNLDVYNQNKLAIASSEFIEQYDYIVKNNLTHLFRTQELEFFDLKKKNKYTSLNDLLALYEKKTGIKKTRAGLSHYLIKLRKIVGNQD